MSARVLFVAAVVAALGFFALSQRESDVAKAERLRTDVALTRARLARCGDERTKDCVNAQANADAAERALAAFLGGR